MSNTQRTVDLHKVQWADYFWINGKGDQLRCKPDRATANGTQIPDSFAWPYDLRYPSETAIERATRQGFLDTWKPVCILHITANRCLTYTGDKATNIWKAYNAHIYKKK